MSSIVCAEAPGYGLKNIVSIGAVSILGKNKKDDIIAIYIANFMAYLLSYSI
jgi:hypothetical protein